MLEYEIKCRRCGKMEVAKDITDYLPYTNSFIERTLTIPIEQPCSNCCKPTLWDVVAYEIVNETP